MERCQAAPGLEVGTVRLFHLVPPHSGRVVAHGWGPLGNGGNISLLPSELSSGKAVMEGMVGESIVHVQEEKGFAFGSLNMQRFCVCFQAAQLNTAVSSHFTKNASCFHCRKGSGLSCCPRTCLLPSRHSTFSTSDV